jgi:hypothetical protein
MATSLPFCANNGISLLVDPVNRPPVAHVYRGHQSIYLLAQQIPTAAASWVSLCATTASSVTEGGTLDSSMSMKDMS